MNGPESFARVAGMVDTLLDRHWNRQTGAFADGPIAPAEAQPAVGATCSCGSGVPVQTVNVAGRDITFVGLPLIFQQMHAAGRKPEGVSEDLVNTVKVYNVLPSDDEAEIAGALLREYTAYCAHREAHP